MTQAVDIVTEWNLKLAATTIAAAPAVVDIVTEWNLKLTDSRKTLIGL